MCARIAEPLPRIEARTTPPISTSSPGSKPGAFKRTDDAHPVQAALGVGERVSLSRSWRARRRSTGSPVTLKAPSPTRSTSKPRRAAGPGRPVLGQVVLGNEVDRLLRRHAPKQLGPQVVEAPPVADEGHDDRHALAHARARQTPAASSAASGAPRGRPWRARGCAARAASRASCRASSRSAVAKFSPGSEPSSGARSRTWTSNRVRSTCARELVAQPRSLRGALDEPGDVSHDELARLSLQRAEDRLERREQVARHFGRRARQPRQQRRLAGVGPARRKPTSASSEPQVEASPPPPRGRARRSAAPDGSGPRPCCRAAAAVGDDGDTPAGRREVVHRAVLGGDLRPRRDAR